MLASRGTGEPTHSCHFCFANKKNEDRIVFSGTERARELRNIRGKKLPFIGVDRGTRAPLRA